MNFKRFLDIRVQILTSLIVSLILLIILKILNCYGHTFDTIHNFNHKDILTLLIQINTVTVSLFTAFFFFWTQSLESNRSSSYLEFRNSSKRIINIYSKYEFNDNEKEIEEQFLKLIIFLNNTKENNFPINSNGRKIIKESTNKFTELKDNEATNLLWELSDLEYLINNMGICFVTHTIMSIPLKEIKKQLGLIVILIIYLININFYSLNELNIIINTSALILSLSSLIELSYFINYYYKNLDARWHNKSAPNNV